MRIVTPSWNGSWQFCHLPWIYFPLCKPLCSFNIRRKALFPSWFFLFSQFVPLTKTSTSLFLILIFVKCFWTKSSKSINQKKKNQIFLYYTMLDRSIANLDPFTLSLSPKYVNLRPKHAHLRQKYVKSESEIPQIVDRISSRGITQCCTDINTWRRKGYILRFGQWKYCVLSCI